MSSHLRDYLNYYKGLMAPGYAVLVTGDWGTGKTYQVRQCLPDNEIHYVKLFGLQTVEEIHAAVLAAVDPELATARKLFAGAEQAAKDVGGFWSLLRLIPAGVGAALRREVEIKNTIVFDDLERCRSVAFEDILGAINLYVEQREARVVVIAHDERIAQMFTETKEKLIGQTIRVQPQVEEAFDTFLSQVQVGPKREFVEGHHEQIITAFTESGANSLRILRHVVEDLGRLYDCLKPNHRSNHEAMEELVGFFAVVDIGIRKGVLKEFDLRRPAYQPSPALQALKKKHPTLDLTSRMLQEDALVEMLVEGRYRPDSVQSSIDNSNYFLVREEARPWQVVINFDRLPDGAVSEAASQMERQFRKREVTESGEMLHIFALRMMMAEEGVIDSGIEEQALECIRYIDDLLRENRLPPRDLGSMWVHPFQDGHGGSTYWVTPAIEPHFVQVFNHLVASRSEALERTLPDLGKYLLGQVQSDGRAFFRQVCSTVEGENPYAFVPVLAHVPPNEFVKAWLASPPDNWIAIGRALAARYSAHSLERDLEKERDWLLKVLDLIQTEAEKAEGFRALRIKRVIPPDLRRLLEHEEEKGGENLIE